jgi:hypothetical protein
MDDYLELVQFVMSEATSSCNGMWLKGSDGYTEKAMVLLQEYKHNFTLAKFHILYPSVMMQERQKAEVMGTE